MSSAFAGEFLGTLTLILLGNGTNANNNLVRTYGNSAGWMSITTGWGLAVTMAVLVALVAGSDAHINPAVTIGTAIAGGSWANVPTYIVAQLLGAFSGAVLVWLHYLPHWRETDDAAAKRACFCTAPAIRHTPNNLMSEAIGTFMLVLVAAAIFSDRLAPSGLPDGIGPFLVGLLVWVIGLALGGPTGYAINPARDLGPRLAHSMLPIAGKGDSGWRYAAIPVLGPLLGAVLAGLALTALAF